MSLDQEYSPLHRGQSDSHAQVQRNGLNQEWTVLANGEFSW